ncbi:MAG: diaminopimelate decarboxylase [Clostridiales bacterium]|jgi:diaminopimelate decarboxylase|nr:diaminopimelate decarboxylase [Clostridiales bacterium]
MFVMDCLEAKDNEIVIGGVKISKLVRKYGTPLYVMDEMKIRENCRAYKDALAKHYSGEAMVLYASKAFCCKRIYSIMKEEGLGADVMSGGELYTAVLGDFPGNKVYFHGNNKSLEEIELAFEHGIHAFIADNMPELDQINMIAGEFGKKANVLIRIKPGIEAHTHEFIKTGQIDSKFGVGLENGEADKVFEYTKKLKNLNILGVHCHIGSQIFDTEPFCLAASRMMEFIAKVKKENNIEITEFDIGGGCGIKYTQSDTPCSIEEYVKAIAKAVEAAAKKNKISLPKLIMEPGRSIVGNAGITIYTVGAVKDIQGVRKYVMVDGGMCDNPRYILYGSEYEALRANKPQDGNLEMVTIAGKCCESGDILIKDAMLPHVETGDLIVVQATGAYNYSMASNYNRITRPAVALVKDGDSKIIVMRERYEDLARNDR